MKIAYIADSPIPSRAANSVQILHMCAAMGSLGHDVTLIIPWHPARVRGGADEKKLHEQYALQGRFQLLYLPFVNIGGRFTGSYFPLAALAARALRTDIVFTRNPRIAVWAGHLGCSSVLESHGLANSPRLLQACWRLAKSENLRRWVFISERLRQLYLDDIALPADKTLVAHDGVDVQRFATRQTREEARKQLSLSPATPLVVHAGHLYAGRGAELIVEVAQVCPEIDFLLVGGRDEDVARLRALVRERRLSNVRLDGHRPLPELPAYLFAADVLVMPYTSSSVTSDGKTRTTEFASPMKLFEYMAAGRAIVSSRFPSFAEVLSDDVNGVFVPPDQVSPLTAAIQRLVADQPRADRLGKRAQADVQRYEWRERAQTILAGL